MAGGGTTALPPAGAYAVAGRGGTLLVVSRDVLGPDPHPLCTGRTCASRSSPCRPVRAARRGQQRARGAAAARSAGGVGPRATASCSIRRRCGSCATSGPRATPHPVARGGPSRVVRGRRLRAVLRAAGRRPRWRRDSGHRGAGDSRPADGPQGVRPERLGSRLVVCRRPWWPGPSDRHRRGRQDRDDGARASRRTGTVAGTSTTSAIAGVTWTADSRWLVLSTSTITFGRLAVWDPRTGATTAMPWAVAQNISADQLSAVGGGLLAWR